MKNALPSSMWFTEVAPQNPGKPTGIAQLLHRIPGGADS